MQAYHELVFGLLNDILAQMQQEISQFKKLNQLTELQEKALSSIQNIISATSTTHGSSNANASNADKLTESLKQLESISVEIIATKNEIEHLNQESKITKASLVAKAQEVEYLRSECSSKQSILDRTFQDLDKERENVKKLNETINGLNETIDGLNKTINGDPFNNASIHLEDGRRSSVNSRSSSPTRQPNTSMQAVANLGQSLTKALQNGNNNVKRLDDPANHIYYKLPPAQPGGKDQKFAWPNRLLLNELVSYFNQIKDAEGKWLESQAVKQLMIDLLANIYIKTAKQVVEESLVYINFWQRNTPNNIAAKIWEDEILPQGDTNRASVYNNISLLVQNAQQDTIGLPIDRERDSSLIKIVEKAYEKWKNWKPTSAENNSAQVKEFDSRWKLQLNSSNPNININKTNKK